MRLVVATVHLIGLGPGHPPVWADENDPQIKRWLNGGQLRDVTPPTERSVSRETPAKPRRRAVKK